MTNIWHVTYRWDGDQGLPGYTNLFFDGTVGTAADALAACTKAKVLFDGIAAWVPTPIVMSLVTDVRLIDDATGDLVDVFTVSGIANSVAAATAEHSAPTGGCIDWLTGTVHGSRRLQGRTFVVPLANLAFTAAGIIGSSTVLSLATAAESMRTHAGPAFGVWGRPRAAKPAATPPVTARAGLWGPATSSRVPTKAAILTSRRD